MLCRMSMFGLVMSFGLTTLVVAKPPDLPIELEDRLLPVVSPWQQLNDQLIPLLASVNLPLGETPMPTPAPKVMLPTVRERIAGCLLFAVNPLMPLVPTKQALDRPCDHPPTRVAVPPTAPEPGTGLYNLYKLLEADELYKAGDAALVAGRLEEAITCFEKAAACCPGSTSAMTARTALHKVFARIYRQGTGTTEEAEPKKVEPGKQAPTNNQPPTVPPDGGTEESEEPWWFPLWWNDSL